MMIIPLAVSTISADQKLDTIKSNCIKKWDKDYRMIKYCYEKQVESYGIVSNFSPSGILSECKRKWGDDYRMIKYCYEKQTKAKRELGL